MRLKMKELFSFLVALAFLVGWAAGANAGFKTEWGQPVHTSNGGANQNNGQVCRDSSGNIAVVWDNSTDVFMQLISPDGTRLLTGEAGALTNGYTVLDRSSSLTLDAATCLADGSVFAVAKDSSTYYMQLVSGGERQWGLDANHKYGKQLTTATVSKLTLLPSGNNVIVAYGNDTATYYTTVDSTGNKDCGGSDWCEIDFASNDTLALVPGSDFWLVGANGTHLMVYGVSGDSFEEAFNGTYDNTYNVVAISDGSGGALVFYNDTDVIRVCDIINNQPGTVDVTNATSVDLEGDYLYVNNGTTLCKYELAPDCSSSTQLTRIWCTTQDVSNNGTFALVDGTVVLTKVAANDVGAILVDDENGKVLLSDDEGVFNNDTYNLNATANLAVFPGSGNAYAVFQDDNTSLKRYAVMKFSWSIKPDFAISLNSVSGDVSIAEDRPLIVQFTASNNGSQDAPADVLVKFYLTNSTSVTKDNWGSIEKVYIGEYTVSAADLEVNESRSHTTTITVSKDAVNEIMKRVDGDIYLAAVINEGKAVDEDPYGDNNFGRYSSTLTTYAPDLSVSSCSHSPSTDLKAGDTVTITCTAENNGNAPAENIEVAFKYSQNTLATTTISSLASSATQEFSANVTLPTSVPESFDVTVYIDPNNLIGESNDTNNSANDTYSGVESGPDLVVDAAAVTPVTINAGDNAMGSFVIKNIGGGNASASVVKLYLSEDNALDSGDTFLAAKAIDALAAGASTADSLEFQVPDNVEAGTYYVLFVADAADNVDELNEDNNVSAQEITVVGGAGATCPELTLVVSNVGGNAEIWVAVPSCGDYCGFPATVAIQADLDGDSTVDYSFVPGMGYYGWVPGEQTFIYPLSVVPAVPVLDDWMGVPYSYLSNATITFNVQVGSCNVTKTWTP